MSADKYILKKQGFSLVELSIVLVILGLLTGGVLAGQSLIRASELRKVISTQDSYRSAIHAFRDKYFALPGDFSKATAFWGARFATSCPNNAGAAVNASLGSCDGDGDGFIYNTTSNNEESNYVWGQLSNAGLITGNYDYNVIVPSKPGVDKPAILNGGVFLTYVGVVNGVNMNPAVVQGNTGHMMLFGAPSLYASNMTAGIMKPDEAFNIDTKLDDGLAGRGKVLGFYDPNDPNVATVRCVNNFNSSSATYYLDRTSKSCSLYFVVD